jgi:hypothetical protein
VATVATYCIQGVHAKNTGDIWRLQPGGAGAAGTDGGLFKGACAVG